MEIWSSRTASLEKSTYTWDGKTIQTCQHCPINTILNIPLFITTPERCFTSCWVAWPRLNNAVPMAVLVHFLGSLQVVPQTVDIYPGGGGARTAEVVPGQIIHSVLCISDPNFDAWFTSTEANWYRTYIKNTHHTKEIIHLPPPMRQCMSCPNGHSVIAIPTLKGRTFNTEELGFMKTRIQRVKGDLLTGIDPSKSFSHETTWMNED